MKIEYDAEVDVLSIYLKNGAYAESDEVAPNIIIDFDDKGTPLAIEILNAKEMLQVEGTINLELPLQISTAMKHG